MPMLGFRVTILSSSNMYDMLLCAFEDVPLIFCQYSSAKRWANFLVQTVSTPSEFAIQYGFPSSGHYL